MERLEYLLRFLTFHVFRGSVVMDWIFGQHNDDYQLHKQGQSWLSEASRVDYLSLSTTVFCTWHSTAHIWIGPWQVCPANISSIVMDPVRSTWMPPAAAEDLDLDKVYHSWLLWWFMGHLDNYNSQFFRNLGVHPYPQSLRPDAACWNL